jgi:hypothetical protein
MNQIDVDADVWEVMQEYLMDSTNGRSTMTTEDSIPLPNGGRRVKVDDEVFAWLQQQGGTPNEALRRLLRVPHQTTPRIQ